MNVAKLAPIADLVHLVTSQPCSVLIAFLPALPARKDVSPPMEVATPRRNTYAGPGPHIIARIPFGGAGLTTRAYSLGNAHELPSAKKDARGREFEDLFLVGPDAAMLSPSRIVQACPPI